MFSDLERSQSWQIQQHHQQQQLQQQQHSYASEQRQSQSQSGWFPLQDSSHHPQQQQVLMRTSADDVYAATPENPILSQQQQQDVGRWVQIQQQHQPASDPYVHDVGRLVPSRPDPAVYPSQQPQMYSHEIGMAPGVTGGGYAAWPQDSRLAGVSVPNGIEDQFQDQFLDRQQQQQPHGIGGVHSGMAMMASASRQPPGAPLYHHHEGVHHPHPHPRRRAKEISIGRWNADEHKWFLKGLEMFQGPAWGEIARLIGTRTSTQVRTHAQKFFTKLARMNQTLPYFDAQIQKERARLLAQGTSVTPTATSGGAFNYALSNLSPRKRVSGANNSPSASGVHMALKRGEYDGGGFVSSSMSSQYGAVSVVISEYQTQTRMAGGYDEQVAMGDKMRGSGGVGGGTAAAYYHGPEDSSSADLFKPKYDLSGGMSPLLRKPRMYTDAAGHPVPSSSSSSSSSLALAADPVSEHSDAVYVVLPPHQHQQQQQHMGYAGLPAHVKDDFDAPRQHYSMVDASQQMSHPHQQHHAYSREPDMGYGMLHAGSSVADPATVGATAAAAATAYPWDNDDASQQQQQRQWLAVPSTSAASSSSHPDTSTSNNNSSNSSSGGSLDAESLPSMNKLLFRGNAVA